MLYVYNCEQQQQNEHKPQPARVCGLDEEEKVYMKIKIIASFGIYGIAFGFRNFPIYIAFAIFIHIQENNSHL